MAAPTITFAFCIESGQLEGMGVRAIQSLRRWGGNLANAPVIAVRPRFGPPLDRATLRLFGELDVRYLNARPDRRYQWSHFLNKPKALLAAEEIAETELIAWMDDDVLIVGEPAGYLLSAEYDFAATAPDRGIGTSGPGDPNEAYWACACQILRMDIDALPYVRTLEGDRIRLYWNAGIFVYRRSTGYARVYHEACLDLFDAHLAHREKGFFFNEQVALSLTSTALRWQHLDGSHNFGINAWSGKTYSAQTLRTARVLHYHDWMSEANRPRFAEVLEPAHPRVAEFLRQQGPVRQGEALWKRMFRSGLRASRVLKRRQFLRGCKYI
jgi:hypothetical protein